MDENLEKKIDEIVVAMVEGEIDSGSAIRQLYALEGMTEGRPEYIVRSLATVDVMRFVPPLQ